MMPGRGHVIIAGDPLVRIFRRVVGRVCFRIAHRDGPYLNRLTNPFASCSASSREPYIIVGSTLFPVVQILCVQDHASFRRGAMTEFIAYFECLTNVRANRAS